MALNDDNSLKLSEADVFMADALALARWSHGPITDEQLEAADEMTRAAMLAWRQSELPDAG